MKTEFTHGTTRYTPGQTFGRETSGGYARKLYREWTRWTYIDADRAWVHDGKFSAPIRATRNQILETENLTAS